MSEVQQKQAKSNIPLFQNYARHEIGLIGESDSIIRMWCSKMSEQLYRSYKSIYVDADPRSKDMVTLVALPCDQKSDQKIILNDHYHKLLSTCMFIGPNMCSFSKICVHCNNFNITIHSEIIQLFLGVSSWWLKN